MKFIYLGWLTTLYILFVVGMSFYEYIILDGSIKVIDISDIFISYFLGYLGATLINFILLAYLDNNMFYTVNGIFDAVWKKFYWTHGVKLQGFFLCQFAYYMYLTNDIKTSLLLPFIFISFF